MKFVQAKGWIGVHTGNELKIKNKTLSGLEK